MNLFGSQSFANRRLRWNEHLQEITAQGDQGRMTQEDLVVLGAQAQKDETQCDEDTSNGDQRPVTEFIEERSCEDRRCCHEEVLHAIGLLATDPVGDKCVAHADIHDISLLIVCQIQNGHLESGNVDSLRIVFQ